MRGFSATLVISLEALLGAMEAADTNFVSLGDHTAHYGA
jgi:hypothetical protein